MDVHFRRLHDDDLPLLHRWLNEPGVVRWWEGDDVTWEAVLRDYDSAATDPAEFWIATVGSEDIGWIQCYATMDSEWTIAQVLSHLGSSAVITQRRLEDALAGQDTPEDFAPGVWDTWNAKSPVAQRDDALAADTALLARIETVAPDDRDRFTSAMGPIDARLRAVRRMRLNEHAFHTWDIEVVADPAATIPVPVAELVIDNLELVARPERLGHSTPAFTMATYQHVLPGMQAEAAATFAALLQPGLLPAGTR
jgi:hypothetical protein